MVASKGSYAKPAQTSLCDAKGARYLSAGASKRGLARRENQDRYRVSDRGIVLCDGIGGADAGEVFAEASCWSCEKLLGAGLGTDEILEDANGRVEGVGRAIGGSGGCSVCLAQFREDGSIDISSRGDVLVFRVDAQNIEAINAPDYSIGWRLEAFLGDGWGANRKSRRYYIDPLATREECLIFASDGVWKSMAPSEMLEVWRKTHGDASATAEQLVSLAGRYGSLDDRSAVVCCRVG